MNTTVHDHPRSYDWALLIMRLAVGVIFVAHGYQKLTQMGFEGVSGMLTSLAVPAPQILGPALVVVELLGGLALIIGLLTRLAALALAVDMLVALLLVHLPNGFFLPEGFEFVFVLFAANLAFMTAGAGRLSIDAMIGGRRRETAAGVRTGETGARRVA